MSRRQHAPERFAEDSSPPRRPLVGEGSFRSRGALGIATIAGMRAARSGTVLLWLAAFTALGFGVILTNPTEPRVQGKRLSEWLDEIEYKGNAPGTSVPRNDPAFNSLANGGPEISEPLVKLWLSGHQDSRTTRARDRWKKLLGRNNGSRSRTIRGWCAWEILVEMGPIASNAAPALLKALDNGPQQQRREAAFALGRIGALPEQAVPAMIQNLGETNNAVVWVTARSLGFFGERAGAALPKLQELKTNGATAEVVRIAATAAICRIDPEQSETCLDDLIAELRKPPGKRLAETPLFLGDMGSSAQRAVPALIEVIDQGHQGLISALDEHRAWRALEKTAPAAYETEYRKRGGNAEDRRWNRDL